MKLHPFIAVAILAALSAPAWAINKCTGPDGRVVFQDAPCVGKGEKLNVRPGSGHGEASPGASAEGSSTPTPKPTTEAQRIEAKISESQRGRRRLELEVRLVPDAQGNINGLRAQCDQQFKLLQDKKNSSANNLAGATWESSISSEMAAVATRCDTRTRELRTDLEALQKECQALSGCK